LSDERAHVQQASEPTRDPLRHVKAAVRTLKAYTLTPRPAAVKIDQNENPYELPPALKQRVVEQVLARPWAAIRPSTRVS